MSGAWPASAAPNATRDEKEGAGGRGGTYVANVAESGTRGSHLGCARRAAMALRSELLFRCWLERSGQEFHATGDVLPFVGQRLEVDRRRTKQRCEGQTKERRKRKKPATRVIIALYVVCAGRGFVAQSSVRCVLRCVKQWWCFSGGGGCGRECRFIRRPHRRPRPRRLHLRRRHLRKSRCPGA